ncbi:GrpB family protein [Alicyclobacillus dauci]|uniref:GrpB family protein n=1 Tax=Alicyclobacillus dauci TaxID=1475485 RepID=A0ABY6Z5V7_9BACL|nr:GrpB family protein [Alicyclobacillus dauci]WAH38269.1 GrpB family protein [Alicyclobacillus dauci]
MTRWTTIPVHLAKDLRPWQVVYMICFAVFGTFANLYVGPPTLEQVFSLVYLLISAASLFIVLPNFRRVLFRKYDPLRTHRFSGAPVALTGTRIYLYILIPMCFVAVLQTFSAISSSFLQFDQTNVSSQPQVQDYITPVLAGMEEVWRWCMIGTVIVIGRMICRRWWSIPSVRGTIFTIAVIASSLGFGSGHIMEFTSHRFRALLLFSGLGAILALMTVITGRILLVMCVHIAYDLWVTVLSTVGGNDVVLGIILYIALLLAPLATIIWRKRLFRWVADREDVVRLEPYNESWPGMYAEEAEQLQTVFRRRKPFQMNHIGSTAVPGMVANACIDIQVGLQRPKLRGRERRHLERIGYEVIGTRGVFGRLLLRKGSTPPIHLHIVEAYGPLAHSNIRIRDYLRVHPDDAMSFGDAKVQIVQDGVTDLPSYTNKKKPLFKWLIHATYSDTTL